MTMLSLPTKRLGGLVMQILYKNKSSEAGWGFRPILFFE